MRVLFLVKSDRTPSSRIRIRDLADGVAAAGLEVMVTAIPESRKARGELFRNLAGHDVVVLQKRLLSWLEWRLLRKNAKVLGFDFDDAIYLKNSSPSENLSDYRSFSREMKFRRTVKGADFVMAANKTLAERVLKIAPGKMVEIIPSSIDVSKVTAKKDYSLANPPIVGWIGAKSTLRYLEHMAPALRKLAARRDFVLRIVADKGVDIKGVRTEFVEWSLSGQYEEMAEFDVGIMPLSKDPFSEGKAAYKLLQYMAAGVPSVCSPVGMNAELAREEKCCLAASDGDEFAVKIEKLLMDKNLREKGGMEGRKLVEKEYTTQVSAAKMAAIIVKRSKIE